MKTLLYHLSAAVFLLMLTGCPDKKLTETQTKKEVDTPATCFEYADKAVPFIEATMWIAQWGEYWSQYTEGEQPIGGFWPVQFETDMASFQALIADYNQFRVYYAFCNENSTGSTAHLLAAPLDNTACSFVEATNIYSFPTNFYPGEPGYTDCTPTGATATTIPFDTAKAWTQNFRTKFGISITNDQFTPEGSEISFTIPIAFSFDKTSFNEHISPDSSTLYVKLGIDTIHQSGGAVEYEFKLLFDTAAARGEGDGIDYVDFAAPCPRACGDGNDPLLF